MRACKITGRARLDAFAVALAAAMALCAGTSYVQAEDLSPVADGIEVVQEGADEAPAIQDGLEENDTSEAIDTADAETCEAGGEGAPKPATPALDVKGPISTIEYINENGKPCSADPFQPTDLSGAKTGWLPLKSGVYYFSKSAKLEGRGSVDGDVTIILFDGVEVEWKGGLNVSKGRRLTIYGQKEGNGKLVCDATPHNHCAGIGGSDEQDCGTVELRGGHIVAKGGEDGAGIGGGEDANGGIVNMYRGTVEATGNEWSAGIGGGNNGNGGSLTVYGGCISANGGNICKKFNCFNKVDGGGAGVGGGDAGDGGKFTVYDGTVNAYSYAYGAGIGGGNGKNGGTITIKGGIVNATCSRYGAAIGGGYKGNGGTLTITGGEVNATSSNNDLNKMSAADNGAAIGGGSEGDKGGSGGTVTIRNATVSATCTGGGAAIGGGEYAGNGCDSVTIENSVVQAHSSEGAGIGGGAGSNIGFHSGDGGKVVIVDSTVYATSAGDSAGIGGGEDSSSSSADSGDVEIRGNCAVYASSVNGFAIGRATGSGSPGKVTLSDNLIVTALDGDQRNVAPFELRAEYCKWRHSVEITSK